MSSKKHIYRVFIALFFLISLVGIYGTFFYCNLVPAVHGAETHSHESGHHHSADNNDHHSEENAPSDGCCTDITSSFLNSAKLLSKQSPVEHAADYVLILCEAIAIERPLVVLSEINLWFIDPPPRPVDLRIFIQSFII